MAASVRSRPMRWLGYAHPAAMVLVLALGLLVLREGIRVRRARLRRVPFDSARHRRLARLFVPLVALGFCAGLASSVWLRDDLEPLDSVHGYLALGALSGLLAAGALGLRLERRPASRLRSIHLICGAGGLLVALGGAIAALAILG